MELPTCEKCGNQYDKTFTVLMNGESHVFDCFECAISKLAPHCSHCNTMIIGHGVEAEGDFFCCAHCAKAQGHFMIDRPIDEKVNHIS
ncbi:MAG: hypothetical protein NDI63_11595 [Pseudobdellovibrio sp.]|nr:hypothetical protein [Pseudobdellovibrio sp.]